MEQVVQVIVHGIKESKGTFEGREFSSCTFHCEVDLAENGAGRSLGRVTRPFKLGDATEFDKWAHLGQSLPLKAEARMAFEASKEDGIRMVLKSIRPLVQASASAKVPA
jgi:hypothetical protein